MDDLAPNKRDKRRKSIASKVRYLNDSFEQDRDAYFSDTLFKLQSQLYALHKGADPEYLDKVSDLEELRDYRLTELFLWEQYQIQQAQKQYEEETAAAIASHDHMMSVVRQKLKARLENQRKRLAEDRALLNISTDHSFFSSAANPTIPTTRNAAVSALSGTERRTLRRRDFTLNSDLSGMSGTETGNGRRRGGAGGAAGASYTSDDSAQSGTNTGGADRVDLDLLKDLDHPRGRGAAKSYNGVKTLKNEEGLSDIAEIADAVKNLKRKFGN